MKKEETKNDSCDVDSLCKSEKQLLLGLSGCIEGLAAIFAGAAIGGIPAVFGMGGGMALFSLSSGHVTEGVGDILDHRVYTRRRARIVEQEMVKEK